MDTHSRFCVFPGPTDLLTLSYIRRNGLHSLGKDLAISVTPHPEYPALLHISPNPTASPSDHPVVRECAYSLLIEEFKVTDAVDREGTQPRNLNKDWRLVAMGYTKIEYLIDPFTLVINFPRTKGESGHDGFCWDKSEMQIYEKLDGKMALLYHYAGQWRVASTQSPDASEAIVAEQSLPKRYYIALLLSRIFYPLRLSRSFKDWLASITLNDEAEELSKRAHRAEEEIRAQQQQHLDPSEPSASEQCSTFAELFWHAWHRLNYELPHNADLCYAFEVLSSHQSYVVRRWKGMHDRIVLHGVRNRHTLIEADPSEIASEHRGWEVVQEFTWDELLAAPGWEDQRKKGRHKKKEEGREEIESYVSRAMRTVSRWNPLEREGIVLCDAARNRIKIRYPQTNRQA